MVFGQGLRKIGENVGKKASPYYVDLCGDIHIAVKLKVAVMIHE